MTSLLQRDISVDRDGLIESIKDQPNINISYLSPCSFIFQQVDQSNTEFKLDSTMLFQILDVKDVYKSDIVYIEELRGLVDINSSLVDRQRTKLPSNTRIVNSVNVDENENEEKADGESYAVGKRLFKLTLQDSFGNLCYGFEIEDLNFLRRNGDLYPIKLGSKIIVKNGTNVCLNTMMLKNENVEFVGGEIISLNINLFERMLEIFKTNLTKT